jgi:drug/metabolite transporter (DMT)-like permease
MRMAERAQREPRMRGPRMRDGMPLVAIAAAAWGLDGVLRKPLATQLDAATVVLWEHLIVVLAVSAAIPSAARAFLRCTRSEQIAIALIGIGASALATALFTEAFAAAATSGDFVSPLVLQKLQPLFAVTLAVVLLGERVRPAFAAYAAPALIGAWLLAFPRPFDVTVAQVKVAVLATVAAALWAAGTVLGRRVSIAVSPGELTVLRYCWGLPAAFVITLQQHASMQPGAGNLLGLLLLALIPGLAALRLYYVGLRSTAASRATFAELAFPATAALIGVLFLGTRLSPSQWIGLLVVVAAVSALSARERRPHPLVAVAVEPSEPVALAVN